MGASNKNGFLISMDRLVLSLTLILYIAIYFMFDVSKDSSFFALVSIVIYLLCIWSLKKQLIEPFGCTGVVLLYFFLSEFGLCIVYSLFGINAINFPSRTIDFLNNTYYTKAILLGNIAMMAYTIGATRKKRVFSNINNENDKNYNDNTKKAIFVIGIILLVYSLLVMVFLFITGRISASMDYSLYREAAFSSSFYSYMIVLYSFGGCFVFAVAEKKQFIYSSILFGLTAFMLLITGNRGEVLFPTLAIYGVLKARKIHIKKVYILAAIIVLILIIPFISTARHAGGWTSLIANYSTDLWKSILDTFTEIGIQIRLTVYVVSEYFTGTRKLIFGYSYYEFLLRWFGFILPSSITDFIPEGFNFRTVYATMGFNQVAESFANFGLPGVICFHYIIGLFMGSKEQKVNNALDVAILGACCSVFINMTRNKYSFVPTHLLFICIFYFIIRFLTKRRA